MKWFLPPSSNVGYGKDTSQILNEYHPACTEGGSNGNIESSIAVQQGRVGAVESKSLQQ